jgi:hypothetical protein
MMKLPDPTPPDPAQPEPPAEDVPLNETTAPIHYEGDTSSI